MPYRLVLSLAALALAWPMSLWGQSATRPAYELKATIAIGLQGYSDLEADPASGRVYLATRDGLRVVDTESGNVTPPRGRLELSGDLEVAPDIDRLFAELDDDYVAFIDSGTLGVQQAVRVKEPGTLRYERATRELYVFSSRNPIVRVFDARTGDEKGAIDLPGWGGTAVLKTPGKIYLTVPPQQGLFVIDTADRSLRRWPLPERIRHALGRFTLVADASGRVLFAAEDYAIVALDADTGAELGRVSTRDRALLAFDSVAGLLLANVSQNEQPLRKLAAFQHDGESFILVGEQTLPLEAQSFAVATRGGFVGAGTTDSLDPDGPPFSRPYITVWDRR